MAFNDAENGTETQLRYLRTLQGDLKKYIMIAQSPKI